MASPPPILLVLLSDLLLNETGGTKVIVASGPGSFLEMAYAHQDKTDSL